MCKTHASKITLVAALCCAFSTACSSGGGGGTGFSTNGQTTPGGTSTNTTATSGSGSTATTGGWDTGVAGTVAAPGPNSFSTAPAQLAMPGGPTFDGSSGSYPANVTFPLLINSLQASSTGLSAVSGGNQEATATVVSASANSTIWQLAIPSVGVNTTFNWNAGLVSIAQDATLGLSYVVMGGWTQTPSPGATSVTSPLQNTTAFVFGYETPPSAVPTSGTAQFSGPSLVSATVYKPVGTEIDSSVIAGNASMSVNFGSGAVTGSFTKMTMPNDQPWNDVSVNASITSGTNRFGGSTAAASSPTSSMALSGSATGSINGAFYGPAAQNLGAVWTLSDGTGSAIGTVVAGH